MRTYNALKRADLNYISDIEVLSKNQLLSIRNLGDKSINEILEAIKTYNNNDLSNNLLFVKKESIEEITHSEENIELDSNFLEKISELKEFILDNDRLPKSYEGSLGSWCVTQRSLKRKGELSEDKIETLEAIKYWVWDAKKARIELMWLESFEELKKFVLDNNRLPDQREIILYRWCLTQRKNHSNGNLSDKRIELMETIPYWEWSLETIKTPNYISKQKSLNSLN